MKKSNVFIILMTVVLIALVALLLFPKRNEPVKEAGKVLYYRNPMDSSITSPVPMKDQMGMDYVPVYEGEAKDNGITLSQEKQQLIGLKKEKIEKRKLTRQILTSGAVAFDPGLFSAQQEYLQALSMDKEMGESPDPYIKDQAKTLIEAASRKLMLLGMSRQEVDKLKEDGVPDAGLYLPDGSAWIYITIYEYEAGLIKEGLPVEIEAEAFPGQVFEGKLGSILPVVDSATRTLTVRARVEDPDHRLKPRMFVNARINVDLGERLAVPDPAVMDTGLRKIVYTVEGDSIAQHIITTGVQAQGYQEVLSGLKDGDMVVTSGNFLVDSESRLRNPVKEEDK